MNAVNSVLKLLGDLCMIYMVCLIEYDIMYLWVGIEGSIKFNKENGNEKF